jgi:hypothetical protein
MSNVVLFGRWMRLDVSGGRFVVSGMLRWERARAYLRATWRKTINQQILKSKCSLKTPRRWRTLDTATLPWRTDSMLSNLTTAALILAVIATFACYSAPDTPSPCCQDAKHQIANWGETLYCPTRGS